MKKLHSLSFSLILSLVLSLGASTICRADEVTTNLPNDPVEMGLACAAVEISANNAYLEMNKIAPPAYGNAANLWLLMVMGKTGKTRDQILADKDFKDKIANAVKDPLYLTQTAFCRDNAPLE